MPKPGEDEGVEQAESEKRSGSFLGALLKVTAISPAIGMFVFWDDIVRHWPDAKTFLASLLAWLQLR